MPVSPELLEAVKNYLDITWEDSALDIKLTGIISRGVSYLNQVSGTQLFYEIEGKARELLFDYVMYVREGKLADFQDNYLSELLALQIHEGALHNE